MLTHLRTPQSPVWYTASPEGVSLLEHPGREQTRVLESTQNKTRRGLIQAGVFRAFQGQADLTIRLQDYSGTLAVFLTRE